jgi:hypothetical protein
MKTFIALMACISVSISAFAQTASVKDIPADGDGETTISISKGKRTQDEYQVTEGKADITGEPNVLDKEARASWKSECDSWKKELKETNKGAGNEIMAMSCNKVSCAKNENSQTVCTSEATYKMRTKVR